jgi:hypothetical protein
MAATPIEQVVNVVRTALGDHEGTQFKLSVIKNTLYNSVQTVNAAMDTSYALDENVDGTYFSSPPGSAKDTVIVGLQCAVDLLVSRQTDDTLNGESGVSFKSGMNSFDNRDRGITLRRTLDDLRGTLALFYKAHTMSASLDGQEIDLYNITNAYLVKVL